MSTRSTFEPQLQYVLRIADSSLIHGQRLSAWCGHAPVLEEDIALANIALDHVGQARALLTLAGQMEGRGRDEDAFAYSRIEREFFNVTMLELPNGDFARTLMRGFLWSAFLGALWPELAASSNAQLGAISAKCAKETRYHQRHCADWVLRLGDGTRTSASPRLCSIYGPTRQSGLPTTRSMRTPRPLTWVRRGAPCRTRGWAPCSRCLCKPA